MNPSIESKLEHLTDRREDIVMLVDGFVRLAELRSDDERARAK